MLWFPGWIYLSIWVFVIEDSEPNEVQWLYPNVTELTLREHFN